jgi:hypothetical protein
MPFVRANPNQYLLTGRSGKLVNRGTAVQAFLTPGTVYVLVPTTKQEAQFAFTQETKDGIPLRFKGIIIYRITEPLATAHMFDFTNGSGVAQINELLTHVALGELRHHVSHMTMAECIEQRKTTLTGVVRDVLEATVRGDGGANADWGIVVDVAQVAQVFIVDAELRLQLEAQVRNEIKLQSDKSDIQTSEEARLTAMASDNRVAEQKLAADRENLRRREELHAAEMAADQAEIESETPVHLLRLEREGQELREELEVEQLRNQVRALEVQRDQLLARAQQDLRREILPLEQAPELARAAASVFHGANLSIYGDEAQVLGHLAPLFDIIAAAARQATSAVTAEKGSATN